MVEATVIINISNELKCSGIYIIKYSNGKYYIGQSKNIYIRALEHNNKNKYPCDKALKKYEAKIFILEKILDENLLDVREQYWIQHYKSSSKENGYNICSGGNASGKRGTENCNAVFDSKQIEEIYDLLINHTELSYIDIAKLYNVDSSTIFKISNGYTYINNDLNYPLRRNNHNSQKKQNIEDYFDSVNSLLSLKEDLKYRWDLTIEKDLIKKYNLPLNILREINNGKLFNEIGEYNYPIRKKNIRNNIKFSQQDILNILNDLKLTTLSMAKIGEKYGIHRDTVSKINKGLSYIIKDYNYPAR